MKLIQIKYCIGVLAALCLTAGCGKKEIIAGALAGDGVTARLKVTGLTGVSEDNQGGEVENLKGFRFEDGILKEIFPSLTVDEAGNCLISPSEKKGELYFVANPEAVDGMEELAAGVTDLADFMRLRLVSGRIGSGVLPMTGSMPLDEGGESVVRLKRSVARVDLSSFSKGISIRSVKIGNVWQTGYVNPQSKVATPDGAGKDDFQVAYDDGEFSNGKRTVLYLVEQYNRELEVEIVIDYKGAWHRLTTHLPEVIERNTVYALHVRGHGASATVDIVQGEWENGEETVSENRPLGLVDRDASLLSEGVTVNASCDTVYVPYYGSDFRLALTGEKDAVVKVDGRVSGVTVQPATGRSLLPVAEVAVSSAVRMPGTKPEYIYLNVYSRDAYSGQVVLAFGANPLEIKGKIVFDENGVCDFGRYVDGVLGELTLPEGREIRLTFAEGSPHWMRLDRVEGNVYRLQGGWRPNDPEADGRIQEGTVEITNPDGSNKEVYTVRRVNWGLPVVNIHGTWWCKYNLRGNVKRFEDQISIQDDPAPHESLAAYLASCTEEELLRLMGHQYQGGYVDGLPLAHSGSGFYYEGMKESGQNFGTLEPEAMAPDGYRIPSYDEYAFFSWGDNVNMGGLGSRPFNNKTGQRLTVTITERDVSFLGQHFGIVSFYDFQLDGNHWVLFGLGHQWNTVVGNIARMKILLATYGHSSNSWEMEGYSSAEKPGNNWFKFVPHNSVKTRTIRCVKTPVDYIY